MVDATLITDRTTANSKLISIFDDLPPAPVWTSVASKMKKREVITKHKPLSPKIVRLPKKKRLSPVLPSVRKKQTTGVAQIIDAKPCIKPDSPTDHGVRKTDSALISGSPPRAPLSAFRLNIPNSPAVSQKLSRFPSKKGTPSKLSKRFSPFIDTDIIVLDDEGKIVRKERRRVSRTGIGANPARQAPSNDVQASKASDPEPEAIDQPRRPKHAARKRAIVVSDDSESEEEEKSPLKLIKGSRLEASRNSNLSLQMSKATLRSVVEVVMPPAPFRTNRQKIVPLSTSPLPSPKVPDQHSPFQPPKVSEQSSLSQQNFVPRPAPMRYPLVSSPIVKPRQLTPIRGGHKRLFDPPSPPSPTTPTDFDLSIDFSDDSIQSPSQVQDSYKSEFEVPGYLKPLLEECCQETSGPYNFSAFIESFPYDPIISRGNEDVDVRFRKIGEASYSEVFGISDVVLKVIPLRDESEASETSAPKEDGPAPTDAKDVRKEIIVTRAMGEVYNGFVKLLKTYVVRGRYPEVLLQLWDEYNEKKGSESVRPGISCDFSPKQSLPL